MAPPEQSPHLSEADLDAYWTGRLGGADEERVELHYLECAECRERAGAVEMLVDALRLNPMPAAQPGRALRAWQLAAAVSVIAALGATWQWARVARDAGVTGAPPPPVMRAGGGGSTTMRVAVEAPTRSATATELTVAADASIVVFDLDVREVAAPGAVLDVSVTGPGGRVIMRVDARSSAEGRIELPLHRSLLEPGRFQFDVMHRGVTVALQVLIQQPDRQP